MESNCVTIFTTNCHLKLFNNLFLTSPFCFASSQSIFVQQQFWISNSISSFLHFLTRMGVRNIHWLIWKYFWKLIIDLFFRVVWVIWNEERPNGLMNLLICLNYNPIFIPVFVVGYSSKIFTTFSWKKISFRNF